MSESPTFSPAIHLALFQWGPAGGGVTDEAVQLPAGAQATEAQHAHHRRGPVHAYAQQRLLELQEDGRPDPKLLCVPEADPRQAGISSIRQIASSQLEEVAEFFRTYRSLEGRVISIGGWRDVDAVPALLQACIAAGR